MVKFCLPQMLIWNYHYPKETSSMENSEQHSWMIDGIVYYDITDDEANKLIKKMHTHYINSVRFAVIGLLVPLIIIMVHCLFCL